jgi:hypothetical protein
MRPAKVALHWERLLPQPPCVTSSANRTERPDARHRPQEDSCVGIFVVAVTDLRHGLDTAGFVLVALIVPTPCKLASSFK